MFGLLISSALAANWSNMIEEVAPGIVSIYISSNRAFDTERANSGVATGFIVDKDRGILLTNRHVVEPGPVSSYAVLLNNEEIQLKPIYRDPVHDFGFYQYDPEDIKFLDVPELILCSECAKVGTEVRLIGNDSGEKISILPATIARLDRGAPNYGTGKFNDFNTFYLQAAAGSSGGSSGSPVLDGNGHVVALNAGGKSRAASSFFLPLNRIERALHLIQNGEKIERGTLQGTFVSEPYDKAARLGLSEDRIARFRNAFPDASGVLVLNRYNPGGPLDGVMKPGDILLEIDNKPLVHFLALESILDSNVNQKLKLLIDRGGEALEVEVIVDDLHRITPDRFIEGCGGTMNTLSYQMARHYSLPVYGVYVASAGYCLENAGLSRNDVIVGVNDQITPDISSFFDAIQKVPNNTDIQVAYFSLNDPARIQYTIVRWNRQWFPLSKWIRDDQIGLWSRTVANEIESNRSINPQETIVAKPTDKVARKLAGSIVVVDFDIPYSNSGIYGDAFRGGGVVLDAEQGIVAVDKDTVPISTGDIEITFEGDVTVPAEFLWTHPAHNLSLVKYNPSHIGQTQIKSATLNQDMPEPGDKIWMVGRKYQHELVWKKTKVNRIDPVNMPIPRVPFFRDENIDGIEVEGSASSVGGVLANKKGEVQALWASFVNLASKDQNRELFGISSYYLQQALDHYQQDDVRVFGAVLNYLPLADARRYGLSDKDSAGLSDVDSKRRVLFVERISVNEPANDSLRVNDIIVKVNGQYVTNLLSIDEAVQLGEIELEVLRSGTLQAVRFTPNIRSGKGVERLLSLGGAMIQDSPVVIADQRGVEPKGAYVSWCAYGAPCSRDKLRPTNRIVAVNGTEVDNLDEFLSVVQQSNHSEPMRLSVLSLRDVPSTIVLRMDYHYWPTYMLERKDGSWAYRELD